MPEPIDRNRTSSERQAATPHASVGSQFHGMWQFYTDAARASILDKLRAAGARSVRLDISWAMLQPTGRDTYEPGGVAFVDHVIQMCVDRDIKPLVLLRLTPGWANRAQGESTLPDNPADFARVAEWAARRWNGKALAWEVLNEQNSADFMTGADPVAYTRLLKAAYPALKRGAPTTPVVFGGMQYVDTDWIRRAYDAGARAYFDVMAVHPYLGPSDRPPSTPDDGGIWTLNHVKTVRDLMVARGDSHKEVWFTEFGWSTHANPAGTPAWGLGVTEAKQAQYLTETVALVRKNYPYVTRMYWYNETDLAWGGVQVQNYGLTRSDLSAKPAMAALKKINDAG
jgi:polysaccharide biosynthesis protein PslG